MSPRTQPLVNAQVEVNRAVFEANQEHPREAYIDECIEEAVIWLMRAQRFEVNGRKARYKAKKGGISE